MARTPRLPWISTRQAAVVLVAVVGGSTLWRGLAARGVKSPWIMPDELIYSSLARSLATGGWFAIRGVRTTAYSIVYPLILAGPFGRSDPSAAYAAAKWENALVMSLAAVPTFLLARRLLPNVFALLAAGLAVLIPSLAYTGVLMTENAFYPLFLLALLAIVRALERPTTARQLVALAAVVPTYLTRAEGIVLVPIFLLAIVLLALGAPDRRGELRRYLPVGLAVATAIAAVVLAEVARGSSPAAFLGTYSSTVRGYPLAEIPQWIAAQLAELELYLVFLPLVPALAAMWRLVAAPRGERARRASAAAAVAAVTCTLLLVAVFSAGPGEQASRTSTYPKLGRSLHERYLFYIVPLFLIFWLYWLRHRREFSNRWLALLLVPAALLPLALPYGQVLTNADFEALALLPWSNSLIAPGHVPLALAVTAAVLLPLLLLRRPSLLVLQVGLVAAFFWLVGHVATNEIQKASVQVPTSHLAAPSWVDAAVPARARVAVLWRREPGWSPATTLEREHALWRAEFFNWSVERYFYVGTPMHYGLPEAPLRLGGAAAAGFRYWLTASPLPLPGKVIAADPRAGLWLYALRPGAR
jgi:hypothetical protein